MTHVLMYAIVCIILDFAQVVNMVSGYRTILGRHIRK